MTALAQGRQTRKLVDGKQNAPQKGSTTIYQGGIVCLDTSGYAVPGAATATLIAVGVACSNGGQDSWANTGSDGASTVDYEDSATGEAFGFNNSASSDEITAAHIGKPCYIVDDNTVALTSNSGARPIAGVVRRVESSLVYVEISAKLSRMLTTDTDVFVSTEQTGTGSSQNVAHGLGVAPTKVIIAVTELPDAAAETGFDVAEGTHTATNVVCTVTNTVKFKVFAWV
jgi:hypothetical protein